MRNWLVLVRERFHPSQYIPMIFVFTLANGMYLSKAENLSWDNFRFIIVFVVMLSFFFRMRLFDEIKDYEVDLQINPTRPLARGLLKIPQVKRMILFLLLLELGLTASLGWIPFAVHALAIGYSLLMYEEFFIGDWLRPHLTTYAIAHTFVSVLLGLSAAVSLTGYDPSEIYPYHIAFFLMNWTFFNLFEFARKTFAPSEERPGVATYSNIFGPRAAYFLSLSEGLIGVMLLNAAYKNPLMAGFQSMIYLLAFAFYVGATALFVMKPVAKNAKLFRAVTGVYLLLHYVLIIYRLGV